MTTLLELKQQGLKGGESVKDEMRRNLLVKLRDHEPLFPGIVGYDQSVIPEVVNAVLSKHHMILLGLRGQAKTTDRTLNPRSRSRNSMVRGFRPPNPSTSHARVPA